MKRRGFTLIELMVVIAIIIILSAIAIPNYLKMTERAKKSRIASDMATLATGLETYRTDWGTYPTTVGTTDAALGTYQAVNTVANSVHQELAGLNAAGTGLNQANNTNATGEKGPVEYLKSATLLSIIDPFQKGAAPNNGTINYASEGNHWVLFAWSRTGAGAVEQYLVRTDSSSTVVETILPTGVK